MQNLNSSDWNLHQVKFRNCLLWNLILSTYQTKNISLKNHYWKILRILLRIYKIKKDKGNISFVFLLQRKTHLLESMAKCALREKISFSCCSRFLLSVLWKSVWLSAHPLFRGSSRYFQSNWQSLDSQEVTQVWNTAQFAQNHAVFCDLWLCEGFYSVWSIFGVLESFLWQFRLVWASSA